MSDPKQDDEFVTVYTTAGPLRAELVKGRLESAGIPAFLKYESAGPLFGILVDGMGAVKVLVSKAREQEARALIGENANESRDA